MIVLLFGSFFGGLAPSRTSAAPVYKFKTGKYVGSGGGRVVSGLGFSPEMVILKSTTAAGGSGAVLKTSAMLDNAVSYLGATVADDTSGILNLESDGFSIDGTVTNAVNVNYTWMAFVGSDCTATGVFCVGNYTGAGSGTKAIATGFTPNIAIVKAATAITPAWRSTSMAANNAQFFMATTQDTTGAYFTTMDATGFTVGASINTAVAYHYVAFKNQATAVAVGTYTGNGTTQSVSGVGFSPDAVIVKDANTTTPVGAVYNVDQSYGNSSSYFTNTANVVGSITSIDATGFSVGADTTANSSTFSHYWMAFGGSAAPSSSGTFKMATGTYTGNAAYLNVNGLGFAPDLVVIKGNTVQAGVFRTSLHSGDVTSYLDAATADFALGIQAINPDGFSIGTSVVVNTNAVTYYWTAYGNAWRPGANSGASDFMVGSYYGNGVSRNITNMPWQPNMVTVKAATAVSGTFRTSDMSAGNSGFFAATAEAANNITAFNADGFTIGTAANVNTAATLYRYFAFKSGANFQVGTYTGTTAAQNVTTAGFQPDNLWVKAATAVRGVEKHANMAAANSAPFINVAEIGTNFTGWLSNGFALVGAAADTNVNGTTFRYVAWKKNTGIVITLGQSGTQVTNMTIPSTNNFIGAGLTLITDSSTANITSIKISEIGTVNATANLANLKLYYKTSGTCNYTGSETLFGTVATFDASQTAIITGNMYTSTSQVCILPILDIGSGAVSNDTLALQVTNPNTDIISSSGIVSPGTSVTLSGNTTLQGSSNLNPNAPTSITQGTSSGTNNIAESAWTTDSTPNLGFTVTDPDGGDTVVYQLQVATDSAFSTIIIDFKPTSTTTNGTVFSFVPGTYTSGTCTGSCPSTLADSSSGYWWRVKGIDNNNAESSWSSIGAISTMDMRIDATSPSGGTVKDGITADQDWNGGELNIISANWTGTEPDITVSGLNKYEYAVQRASDNYYWNTTGPTWQAGAVWYNNTTSTTFTLTPIYLETDTSYFSSVRTTDNAGNAAIIVSNGQQVLPSLSYSMGTNSISFNDLNNSNSYTDTKLVTFTTSTNAKGGYNILSYMTNLLTSVAYPGKTIPSFSGSWASPITWGAGLFGFGYTSSDISVGGSNRFATATKYCAYNATAPGNAVADNGGPVNGQTGSVTNEQFTVTNKVSVSNSQEASKYSGIIYYLVTANY